HDLLALRLHLAQRGGGDLGARHGRGAGFSVAALPVAERVGLRAGRRRWRRRVRTTRAAGRRWRAVLVAVVRAPPPPPFGPALALDDRAERRHAARIELDVECRQVERLRFEHVDLAAAVVVARHDVDVAAAALAAVAWAIASAAASAAAPPTTVAVLIAA